MSWSSIVQLGSQNGQNDDEQRFDSSHIEELTVTNLSLPTEIFLNSAISFKNQVVEANTLMKNEEEEGGGGGKKKKIIDPSVYTGLLGTAFTCLRSYQATGNKHDLLLCTEIVDSCAMIDDCSNRHVTFLCGKGGVYALGTVVANYSDNHQRRDLFLNLFLQVFFDFAAPLDLNHPMATRLNSIGILDGWVWWRRVFGILFVFCFQSFAS